LAIGFLSYPLHLVPSDRHPWTQRDAQGKCKGHTASETALLTAQPEHQLVVSAADSVNYTNIPKTVNRIMMGMLPNSRKRIKERKGQWLPSALLGDGQPDSLFGRGVFVKRRYLRKRRPT
jgi:hypothetical protein